MHRFGRSAQQKMKDRWGGSFILATILALVGAWFAGSWLNDTLKGDTVGIEKDPAGITQLQGNLNGTGGTSMATPRDFKLYLVQVGAFRSESSAQRLARTLSEKGYTGMVAPKNAAGLYKVYGGIHTTPEAAQDTRDSLLADGLVKEAQMSSIGVSHNPDVVPVMATTAKGPDFKKGLEAMNTYLYEVAVWLETQTGDTAALASKGQYLSKMATDLNKLAKDNPMVSQFASLASAAGSNATAIQAAAKAAPDSVEQQKATSGYLALLDQYRSLQSPAPGN